MQAWDKLGVMGRIYVANEQHVAKCPYENCIYLKKTASAFFKGTYQKSIGETSVSFSVLKIKVRKRF